MNKKPKVSIIIPVYNGKDYVEEAIDSALNQTYDNKEIIVVNDGSKDNTEEICLRYKDKIKYYSKENGGVSTALNLAISKATGEYISWLSHDDLYYSNKIEEEIKFADNKTIVMSDYDLIDENGKFISKIVLSSDRINNSKSVALMKGYINGITLLIPKNAFDDCGEFDPELKCTQDYDMWFKMILSGYKFKHVEKSLAMSRQHRNQTTNTSPRMVSEGNALWINMFTNLPENIILEDYDTKYSFYRQVSDVLKLSPYFEAYNECVKLMNLNREQIDVSNIKVSVIIPFYDEKVSVIKRAVDSVLNQSHKNTEIILINDNPDSYKKNMLKEILTNENIVYLENEKNLGVSISRNNGINIAKGEYISFLDADDEYLEDKILTQLVEMVRNGSKFSHTSYLTVDETNKEKVIDSGKQNGDVLKNAIVSCRIATPSVMINKNIITDNNYKFNEKIGIGEDTCFWLNILIKYDLLGIDIPLVKVHIDSNSAAYNDDKQFIGLQNILTFVLNNSSLNKYSLQVAQLAYSYSKIILNNSGSDELNNILNSKSWKITKPLRLMSKTFKSLKDNGVKGTCNLIKRYLCKNKR